MPNTTLTVEGLTKTLGRIKTVRLAMSDVLDKSTKEGARKIQKAAKKKAPKDTGRLRKSIKVKKMKKGAVGYFVKPYSYIAHFHEYGTKKGIKPKHFMKESREEVLPEVQEDIMKKIGEVVDK